MKSELKQTIDNAYFKINYKCRVCVCFIIDDYYSLEVCDDYYY